MSACGPWRLKKERKKTDNPREASLKKERKKTDNEREGWEDASLKERKKENRQPKGGMGDGTPPPHRDF